MDFLAWAWNKTDLNSGQCNSVLTSVVSALRDQGGDFDRRKYPSIRRSLNGFKKWRPPKRRIKRPFCNVIVQKVFKLAIDYEDYDDVIMGICVLLGHDLGLRPGEYTFKKGSERKLLYFHHVTFLPTINNSKEICIIIPFSKTNPHNDRIEIVFQECKCILHGYKLLEVPCLVHLVKRYFKMREAHFKEKLRRNDVFLVLRNNKHIEFRHISNFLFNVINLINRKYHVNLEPRFYTPHALRKGGCTDKALEGVPSWAIEKWGRWKSDIWKEVYVSLNLIDICRLTGKTTTELTRLMNPVARRKK